MQREFEICLQYVMEVKFMLIELCGPSGVGKTSLLSSFKNMVYGIVFPDDSIKEPFAPPVDNIYRVKPNR